MAIGRGRGLERCQGVVLPAPRAPGQYGGVSQIWSAGGAHWVREKARQPLPPAPRARRCPRIHEQKKIKNLERKNSILKQMENFVHVTHVNNWEVAVYMSYTSQNLG